MVRLPLRATITPRTTAPKPSTPVRAAGTAVAWIGERYKPELFWVAADRRSASWIIDVIGAGQEQ